MGRFNVESIGEYTTCKVCNSDVENVNHRFDLVQCISCKLVFCKKIFSQQTFIDVYNELYNVNDQYKTHLLESKKILNNEKVRIGKVKKRVLKYLVKKNIHSVAEIGAGVGLIANFFADKKINYQGIELDSKTVERAAESGLPVRQGDFTTLKDLDVQYDAVVAFEVIEHLQELNELFLILKEQLKSGGYFGFTVPNYEKRKNFKNPKDNIYQSPPPVHLNFFTIESLTNISRFYGFKIVFIKEKKLPYLLLRRWKTYKNLVKGLLGNYRGATIMGVIVRE